LNVLTIPLTGNPGSLDYYTKFMHYIQDQLPDSHALLALSHVGADPRLPPPEDGPLDLPQHLATKVDFIQSLKQSLGEWARETDNNAPQPKVALVGHSVGAWLTVEIMKRVDIEAGYLMFPTLGWIADTHNGWKLWASSWKAIPQPLLTLAAHFPRAAVPVPPHARRYHQAGHLGGVQRILRQPGHC
jgi:dienelactone hydrolase